MLFQNYVMEYKNDLEHEEIHLKRSLAHNIMVVPWIYRTLYEYFLIMTFVWIVMYLFYSFFKIEIEGLGDPA